MTESDIPISMIGPLTEDQQVMVEERLSDVRKTDAGPCETPMSDHVARFWETLAEEHVRILIDIRRPHEPDSGVMYHWDSASFSNDVAKALLTLRRRSAPVPQCEAEPNEWREALQAAQAAMSDGGIEDTPFVRLALKKINRALYAAPARCDAPKWDNRPACSYPDMAAPPSRLDAGSARTLVIEECARELETSYPDHAWLNAACAAIRGLSHLPVTDEPGREEVREQVAIRAAQIDERWRQAMRELRDLSIDEGAKQVERRCFDLIMFGPTSEQPQ